MPPTSPTSTSSKSGSSKDIYVGDPTGDDLLLNKEKIVGAFASFLFLMAAYAFCTFDHRKIGAVKLSTTPEEEIECTGSAPIHVAEMT